MRLAIARGWAQERSSDALLPIGLIAISYVLYVIYNSAVMASAATDLRMVGLLSLTMIFAAAIRDRTYADLPRFVGVFIRVIGVFVFVQVCFDSVNFSPGATNIMTFSEGRAAWIAMMMGLIGGAVALYRPAFLIPLLAYYISFRESLGWRTGIPVVGTDYLGMADAGLFGVIGCMVILLGADRLMDIVPQAQVQTPADRSKLKLTAFSLVWAAMVGVHLRSYFFSGISKLYAGQQQPLTWPLHNSTGNSILIGLERGDNPLSHLPWALQGIWDVMADHTIIVNSIILIAQLLAPIGAFNRRILIVLAVFYDMFHIGVYLTLGALFFFWIVVNIMIVETSRHLPDRRITRPITMIMLLFMLFTADTFYTNRLGWLDGPKLASTNLFAKTRDGRTVPIPGPYFGIYAYNIAQNHLYVPPGSFPPRVGGNTHNLADWRDAMTCGDKVSNEPSRVSLTSVQNMGLDDR